MKCIMKTKFLSVLVTALVAVGWQQSGVAAEKVYQEVGGLLVIENEHGPYAYPFVAGTAKPGYTGSSYITWAGAGVTTWPSGTEDFPYVFKFNITHPGRYYFVVHNWIASAYCSFFAQLDGKPQTTHHFSYSYVQKWNWQTWNDTGAGGPSSRFPAYYDLTAGIHTLAFKGRSGNSTYLMDRFHLYLSSVPNPLNTSLPESPYTGGSTTPPPPPPPPPPPTTGTLTTINDDSSRVTYSGGWTDNNAASSRINGDEHYTVLTGASAQFTFLGTQITWVATKFSNRGKADVYIDGVLQTTVDEYSASVLYQQPVYVKTGLSAASHTIKIVCKGTKNASSKGTYIDIDAFKYK
jgi:hypothetical protein